ncbi:MAG: c-type cytochrome [Casimicrobiaceae bacterium]
MSIRSIGLHRGATSTGGARIIAFALLGFTWCAGASAAERADDEPVLALYRNGVLPSGASLIGTREGGAEVSGKNAACASCHRRSGLGVVEGRIVIPPITGHYLFNPGERPVPEGESSPLAAAAYNRVRYTEATLARAIRSGIGSSGKPLSPLMPRFALDDATMSALTNYLRTLSATAAPGVEKDTLHFATIVTADADPQRTRAMLEVLNHFFDNKDAYYRGKAPPLDSARRIHYRVLRRWQLHVWTLAGAPETWDAQLRAKLRAEPVMAVISGISGRTWEPVHRFCEQQQLPCLLPNVDLPVLRDGDFYSVYYFGGVLLEAKLLAARLPAGTHRLVQVFHDDDIGAAAATALASAAPHSMQIDNDPLGNGADAAQLAAAVTRAAAGDALILWLRPEDLRRLPATASPASVWVSGLMGGLEHAPLPAAWLATAHLSYPFDLPEQRRLRMTWPLTWFKIQGIQVTDERTQTDTYLSCVILAESVGALWGNFVRDYLLETYENMLSSRILNAYYPHLSLGPGQRIASKGGYIVHFADAAGKSVVKDGEWTVP